MGRRVPFCLHKKSMTSKVYWQFQIPFLLTKPAIRPSSFSLLSSPHVSRLRSLDFHVSQSHRHLFRTLIYQHPILIFSTQNPNPRHHTPQLSLSLSNLPFSYFDPDASILVLLLFSKFIHQIKKRKIDRENKERRKTEEN